MKKLVAASIDLIIIAAVILGIIYVNHIFSNGYGPLPSLANSRVLALRALIDFSHKWFGPGVSWSVSDDGNFWWVQSVPYLQLFSEHFQIFGWKVCAMFMRPMPTGRTACFLTFQI